ncbi:hypothetical protein J6E39_09745 [bacterium]|nr:hypothetical protein [bacterium]
MKKFLAVLSLLAFTLSAAIAMDGDTYRAEREHVEGLANSGYVVTENPNNNGEVSVSSTSGQTKVKKKRRFFAPDMNSYYHFGAFTKYTGSNGH